MAKMRSPNYPAVGLSESLQRVRNLWAKEKRTPVDPAVAAEAIGYSGLSGPSRTALSSMKKYGLVDSDDRAVRVSDLALRILHPESQATEVDALQEAALNPELFRQIFETQRDASDGALRSFLINKLGFSEVGAKQLIRAYRDTMTMARLDITAGLPSAAMNAEDYMEHADSNPDIVITSPAHDGRDRAPKTLVQFKSSRNTQQTYSWPLSPGVMAEVKIIGDEAKPQYLSALRSYLELAEKLMGSGVPPPMESVTNLQNEDRSAAQEAVRELASTGNRAR